MNTSTNAVGDSFGIFPKNHLGHVDQIIALLGAAPLTPIRGRTLREVLTDEVTLGAAPDALFELFSYILGGKDRELARALARGEDPHGDAQTIDVLAVLHKFPSARPHAEAFVDALEPLQPRLYSISSSPKAEPGRLTLTVDSVRYVIGKRKRLGVASTYLGERAMPGDRLRAYVQKAHNFALPSDPKTPIIMCGPGTGIAPFRAFLHERKAIAAPGSNWLFFGHQRSATDFFYKDELQGMQTGGTPDPPVARMVPRRRSEVLRAGSYAPGWRGPVALVRRRCALLRVRRRQADGQGRRGCHRRYRGRARRQKPRGRRRFRGATQEGRALSSGRVLSAGALHDQPHATQRSDLLALMVALLKMALVGEGPEVAHWRAPSARGSASRR